MHKLAAMVFLVANAAFAHEGHGASAGHLHGLAYGVLAAVIIGVAIYIGRKVP